MSPYCSHYTPPTAVSFCLGFTLILAGLSKKKLRQITPSVKNEYYIGPYFSGVDGLILGFLLVAKGNFETMTEMATKTILNDEAPCICITLSGQNILVISKNVIRDLFMPLC